MRSFLGRLLGRFLYLDAGQGAQPEVQAAIERFRELPETERAKVHLWGWLLGPQGTPPYKIDRADIQWSKRPTSQGACCGRCGSYYEHVVTGTGICSQVSGVWQPRWWCDRYKPPQSPEAYRRYQR